MLRYFDSLRDYLDSLLDRVLVIHLASRDVRGGATRRTKEPSARDGARPLHQTCAAFSASVAAGPNLPAPSDLWPSSAT